MKFIVQRELLLKPLQQVSSPLVSRPALPILRNLLLQVTEDTLSITSTDLEIEIIAHITLSQLCNGGETTVSARKFFNICRSLPEKSDILVQLDGNHLLLSSGKSRFFLSTIPALDFPNFNDWQSEIEFTISQVAMRRLIETTQFSMANQDVRYYLNGMLLETDGKDLNAVATDGHRLAMCSTRIDCFLSNHSAIIPRKGVIELMRMLDTSDIPLHVQIGSNNIRAYIGNFIFTSKLIEGNFPNYRCVLLKNHNKKLEANRYELKQAFARAAIISNEKFRGVRLFAKTNQVKITANNLEQEKVEEILPAIYTGTEIEIGFNVNYVLDVLNALKCECIRILFTDSVSSFTIEDVSSQSTTYVIMPMRL